VRRPVQRGLSPASPARLGPCASLCAGMASC
jgi:hypothetical protein